MQCNAGVVITYFILITSALILDSVSRTLTLFKLAYLADKCNAEIKNK